MKLYGTHKLPTASAVKPKATAKRYSAVTPLAVHRTLWGTPNKCVTSDPQKERRAEQKMI